MIYKHELSVMSGIAHTTVSDNVDYWYRLAIMACLYGTLAIRDSICVLSCWPKMPFHWNRLQAYLAGNPWKAQDNPLGFKVLSYTAHRS